MNAQEKNRALAGQIAERLNPGSLANGWHPMGRELTEHAATLRRAQMTLHRWAEEICNGTIQRDGADGDGQPFRHYGNGTAGPFLTTRIPDRERGALARIAKICKASDLHFYHQTDPRGCALYVSAEPLTDQNYSRAIACL